MALLLAVSPLNAPLPLSPAQPHWPEPLCTLVARNLVDIEVVSTLHEAAARLSLPGHPDFAALIVDTESLTHREISLLQTFKRHRTLPIWLLPVPSITRPRYQDALGHGAVPWKDALLAIARLPLKGLTQQPQEGSNEDSDLFPDLPPADNKPPHTAKNRTEVPIATDLTARYDELDAPPLLTDQEMRALLGTAE